MLITTSAQAAKIEACMTQECIEYFNTWKKMSYRKYNTALSVMGELYYQGYGTEKNLDKSFKYFKKAAKYKFAYGEYRTALFYLAEQDYLDTNKGIKYLKRAARNGHTESSFLLALTYGSGELTEKNTEESDKWLDKAIQGKSGKSKSYASFLHQSGELTYKDYPKVSTMISLLKEEVKPILKTEPNDLVVENTKINWPEESDVEVIQVSAPSVEAIFDHELAYLTINPPASQGSTGTRIIGKTCNEMVSCGSASKADFERLIMQLW
jgi:hypothetical protein